MLIALSLFAQPAIFRFIQIAEHLYIFVFPELREIGILRVMEHVIPLSKHQVALEMV
jgi:hypothetical protein